MLRLEIAGASLEDVFVELTHQTSGGAAMMTRALRRSCSAKGRSARPTRCSSSGTLLYPLGYLLVFGIGMNASLGFTSGLAGVDYNAFFLAGVLGMASFGIASNTVVVVLPRSRQRHLLRDADVSDAAARSTCSARCCSTCASRWCRRS